MTDNERVREVIDETLRHLGSQREITASALASHASQRLGRVVTVADVTDTLVAYERQGKIGLARQTGSTPTVTSVSPTFLKQLHEH